MRILLVTSLLLQLPTRLFSLATSQLVRVIPPPALHQLQNRSPLSPPHMRPLSNSPWLCRLTSTQSFWLRQSRRLLRRLPSSNRPSLPLLR